MELVNTVLGYISKGLFSMHEFKGSFWVSLVNALLGSFTEKN